MLKVTLWHEPNHFTFYLSDIGCDTCVSDDGFSKLGIEKFFSSEKFTMISVISEFSEVPITVEFDRFGYEPVDENKWDRIVEASIKITKRFIVFESSIGDEFGKLEVGNGDYRLRIYYGGQNTRELDGSSNDFYLIQIWPSNDKSEKVIKS